MNFYRDIDKYKDNIAVITDRKERLTYKELLSDSDVLMNNLEKRTVLFLVCRNCIESICAYIGALRNGIVPVMINEEMNRELFYNLYNIYKPAYLYGPENWNNLEQSNPERIGKYREFVMYRTGFKERHKLNDKLALLLTTSGSTGSPKLVRQSYVNIVSNARAIAEYLELNEVERPITTLPMNYTYGLSIINSHLLVGAAILLTDYTLLNREFWNFFKEEGATSFGGVPYTYEILKKLRFFRMELPSLKTMTQAGGKLSPELHKEFARYAEENNKRFVVMYGQTEATARMAYLPWNKSIEKCGSMGIAIPGGKLWLRDEEGNAVTESDVIGELIYEGENVTLGYAETAEDLEKDDERGGVLETGDMAKCDSDGYFYIVGRKKRFLKIFGNRVNLDEAERMIKEEFTELDCACAGLDDKLYVFVTIQEDRTIQAVKRFLAQKTGLNPTAFSVKAIDKLPKNEAGKTLYKNLEMFYD
ncbi:MAG: AMP-binding protein [Lachnospiraceae bacterium]